MHLINVSGNLASGKSSLAKNLGSSAGWHTIAEVAQPVHYLPDLFADPPRWALESQLAFLASKISTVRAVPSGEGWAVIDRSVDEHAEVFARRFYEGGAMDDRAYGTYRAIYELLLTGLPAPAAVIFCACPVSTCEERMRKRARDFDLLYPPGHLTELDRLGTQWIASFTAAPVFTLDTATHDVRLPETAAAVARDVARALEAPQAELEILVVGHSSVPLA